MTAADLIVNSALGLGFFGAVAVARVQRRGRLGAEEHARTVVAAAEDAQASASARTAELRQECERQHREAEAAAGWYRSAVAEAEHLWKVRLPAVIEAEVHRHPGVVVPALLNPGLQGTAFETLHREVAELLLTTVEASRTKVVRSARAGVRGIADEAQTHLARLQDTITEELTKHAEASEYHAGLFAIDRAGTRALHALQRLRVLAGSWPGMLRADATFREVVESARGRIGPYDRVAYNYQPETGEQLIEGRVIEPIAIALAELMENGASCSPAQVDVYLLKETNGFQVVIADGGGGMNSFQRDAAARILSGRTVLDVTALEDERKLGFPVVALLSQEYGFRADVSAPSIRGGVKAVLFVPSRLFAPAPRDTNRNPAPAVLDRSDALPAELPAAPAEPAVADEQSALGSTTVSGLPKRRRVLRPEPLPEQPGQEPLTDTYDPQAIDAGFGHLTGALREAYDSTEETNDDQ
ncbi:histidine kinase [Streptomyces sp. NPDC058653]|uniref:histidine kinase n=1 Tax=Streptomyces sp. NPDC058653 TaxID=3346576 RepID=UPI003648A8F7